MRTETFIMEIMQTAKENGNFEELRGQIPLGVDMGGDVVTAQKRAGSVALRHTCVTGSKRVECICNMLIMLSCFYEKDEANFIILSPRKKYAELLGLKNMNVIAPYVRTKDELATLKVGLRDVVNMYSLGSGYPHLFLVLDGLEELPDCNVNDELKEYMDLFAWLTRRPNIEIISGVNLMKSIYSGCPGAFVGIGNCLITTRADGKADVTYVGEDTNLSMPILIDFPSEPSVKETVQLFNGLYSMENGISDASIGAVGGAEMADVAVNPTTNYTLNKTELKAETATETVADATQETETANVEKSDEDKGSQSNE